jgi:hypothetical protein
MTFGKIGKGAERAIHMSRCYRQRRGELAAVQGRPSDSAEVRPDKPGRSLRVLSTTRGLNFKVPFNLSYGAALTNLLRSALAMEFGDTGYFISR